ncbi:MAG: NADH-quinone oxidoreductase subunit L [Gemmataceae bacterium]
MTSIAEHPGLLYVGATLLPLASFTVLLIVAGFRALGRAYRTTGAGNSLYQALGGDTPPRWPAYVATAAIAGAFLLSVAGFIFFVQDFGLEAHHADSGAPEHATPNHDTSHQVFREWSASTTFAKITSSTGFASSLELGYKIDSLSAIMFLMVTFIATLIHLFSMGYMAEELQPMVEDHQVHTDHGHFSRRGRFGQFFMFLSLFCFSMLNLVLADNLFQVFVSWELVGICSYLLVGFYYERQSASNAANKAFITNRIGDAGFILGLLIIWTYVGTFNFDAIFKALPDLVKDGQLPYALLTAAGLGIFLGCVGKSAQFPLHVWLPDAMEGPTPVSALIHAATMVAAGVYLVGRAFPLMTPDARLVIAYTGGITLFVAATVAIVMTDIKKVLAYSTVSQLGYMMLALGVGGWVAGLFHLLTHAFFKALLFLGSGSVIYGCHHEQDMTKMGGLRAKMPITAYTMLMGVLAICGIPLFSGWYSKDAILAQAYGFYKINPAHILLFVLPLTTAGITAFYMFRMWFLTFTGRPRDEHVYEHAREAPKLMTMPLIVLAVFSVAVAWGWPLWSAEQSLIGGHGKFLEMSQPKGILSSLNAVVPGYYDLEVTREAAENHSLAEILALGAGGLGIVFALLIYLYGYLNPAESIEQFPGVFRFLSNKWYFDELYSVLLVGPALVVAYAFRFFDMVVIDGILHFLARLTVGVSRWDGIFDGAIVDGLVNLTGRVIYGIGGWLRGFQTGYLRSYILFLVLAATGLFLILRYFVNLATAG